MGIEHKMLQSQLKNVLFVETPILSEPYDVVETTCDGEMRDLALNSDKNTNAQLG